MAQLTEQINITINHDWSPLIKVLDDYIVQIQKSSKNIKEIYSDEYYAMYSIGNESSIVKIPRGGVSYNLQGEILHQYCPWLRELYHEARELGLCSAWFSKLIGPFEKHVDPNLVPGTAFNHFFTDVDSRTVALGDNYQEHYYGNAGTTWMLNTKVEHYVENTGERYWFSFRSHKPFEVCKEWFRNNPSLVYPKQ